MKSKLKNNYSHDHMQKERSKLQQKPNSETNKNNEEVLQETIKAQLKRETTKGGETLDFDEDFSSFGTGHVEFLNGKWLIGLGKHSSTHV